LGVWDWKSGLLKKKVDLRRHVEELAEKDGKVMLLAQRMASKKRRDEDQAVAGGIPIAVNGIWESPLTHSIYVGLEG